MARQTRAQRRARRAEGERAPTGVPPRAPRRPTATGGGQPAPQPAEPRAAAGGGARRFVSESWAELKKVEWPGQSQLIQGVVVVLVACIVVGIFLWGADQLFKPLVQKVFLR
jgi:preprotein translocase subunit SecE